MILPALLSVLFLVSCGKKNPKPKTIADKFIGTWTVLKATSNGNDATSLFSGVSVSFKKSSDTGGSYTAQVSGSLLAFIGGNGVWKTNASSTQLTIGKNVFPITNFKEGKTITVTFTDTTSKNKATYTLVLVKS